MDATITVNVTQEHIDKAKEEYENLNTYTACCPVAQALRSRFPDVRVGFGYFYPNGGNSVIYKLPDIASKWISHYDILKEGLPFDFTAELVNTFNG